MIVLRAVEMMSEMVPGRPLHVSTARDEEVQAVMNYFVKDVTG